MKDIIMFGLPLIEWIGYLASTLVLISLSLSSIVRLRIFNLAGSSIFSFYGFYIGALPVGIMNLIICFFNLYYLRMLYFKKEKFDVIEANANDNFLHKFIIHYNNDIKKYFPDFSIEHVDNSYILLALRDMNVTGVFISTKTDSQSSEILIDYVIPQYRDYKMGKFIFTNLKKFFKKQKVNTLTCKSSNPKQINYLKRMGFHTDKPDNSYTLSLN